MSRYAKETACAIYFLKSATAPNTVFVVAASSKHLHSLHLGDPVHAWPDGRPGLFPRLPCEPRLDAGAHCREDCCDEITSVSSLIMLVDSEIDLCRLWVTDPLSPSSSGPSTPSHSTAHIPLAPLSSGATASNRAASPPPSPLPPFTASVQPSNQAIPHRPAPPQPFANNVPFSQASTGVTPPLAPSIPASALPGARLSGRLVGVVSLTDILNLHARASGLSPADPGESRRRRRSSSSSMSIRRSGEIGRELFSRGSI